MNTTSLLSVVAPVLNEAAVISAFYDRMRQVVDALSSMSYELIFVDDGSTDEKLHITP